MTLRGATLSLQTGVSRNPGMDALRSIFCVPPPDGHEWVLGRLTKKQKSLRPPNVWPEIWSKLSPKQKEMVRAEWIKEKPKLEAAQAAR